MFGWIYVYLAEQSISGWTSNRVWLIYANELCVFGWTVTFFQCPSAHKPWFSCIRYFMCSVKKIELKMTSNFLSSYMKHSCDKWTNWFSPKSWSAIFSSARCMQPDSCPCSDVKADWIIRYSRSNFLQLYPSLPGYQLTRWRGLVSTR